MKIFNANIIYINAILYILHPSNTYTGIYDGMGLVIYYSSMHSDEMGAEDNKATEFP